MKNYNDKWHSKLGEHNLIPTSSNGFIPTPTKNSFVNKINVQYIIQELE